MPAVTRKDERLKVAWVCPACDEPFRPWKREQVYCTRTCARRSRPRRSQPHVNNDGYVLVPIEDDDPLRAMGYGRAWILEHRLVMARHIGRLLDRHETVHHVNGNRQDNRIENLQLHSGRHGKGAALRCRSCGSVDIEALVL